MDACRLAAEVPPFRPLGLRCPVPAGSVPSPRRGRAGRPGERTAVILVWLRGGCSHLDTCDPKPDAPAEYRGPFGTLQTRTPGLRVTELLLRHAKVYDRFTILRSMAHTGGVHPADDELRQIRLALAGQVGEPPRRS